MTDYNRTPEQQPLTIDNEKLNTARALFENFVDCEWDVWETGRAYRKFHFSDDLQDYNEALKKEAAAYDAFMAFYDWKENLRIIQAISREEYPLTVETLQEWGADTKTGLQRCMNNPDFYLKVCNYAFKDAHPKLSEIHRFLDAREIMDASHKAESLLLLFFNLCLNPLTAPFSMVHELKARSAGHESYRTFLWDFTFEKDSIVCLAMMEYELIHFLQSLGSETTSPTANTLSCRILSPGNGQNKETSTIITDQNRAPEQQPLTIDIEKINTARTLFEKFVDCEWDVWETGRAYRKFHFSDDLLDYNEALKKEAAAYDAFMEIYDWQENLRIFQAFIPEDGSLTVAKQEEYGINTKAQLPKFFNNTDFYLKMCTKRAKDILSKLERVHNAIEIGEMREASYVLEDFFEALKNLSLFSCTSAFSTVHELKERSAGHPSRYPFWRNITVEKDTQICLAMTEYELIRLLQSLGS